MKFKGTKGNWFACCVKTNPHFLFDEEGNTCIAGFYQKQEMRNDLSDKEFKANALLISKAPELLEMLNECKLQLEYLNEKFTKTGTTNSLLSKIELLIKQATEL